MNNDQLINKKNRLMNLDLMTGLAESALTNELKWTRRRVAILEFYYPNSCELQEEMQDVIHRK